MTKAQHIKGNKIITGHRASGGCEVVTIKFENDKWGIKIIAISENKDEKRKFTITHEFMDDAVDALIEWLDKNWRSGRARKGAGEDD